MITAPNRTTSRPLGLLAVLVAAMAMLVPASSAQAAPEAPAPARIGGVVSDANGDAVEGALVQLLNRRGDVIRRARTNADGVYVFNVRPGRFLVRAAKRDVGTDRARVGVRSGGTARVPLTLE